MLRSLIAAGLAVATVASSQDLAAEAKALGVVQAQPSADNWQKLGLARYLQNKYAPAIEALGEAVKLNPTLWTAHLFLGISQYRINHFGLALASLRQADRLAPAVSPGRDDIDYWCGATHIALGQPVKGLHALERLLGRNPHNSDALQLTTETYAETSSRLWNRVAELAFDTAPGQEVHGYALESDGDQKGALEAFRRARELAPQRPGPGAAIGRLMLGLGELDGAREALAQELKNDPASPAANLYAGLLALRENRLAAAVKFLQTATAWQPYAEEPPLALCQAYLALGDAVGAVAAARQAVKADGRSIAAHELLMTALIEADDRAGAETEKQRWLQTNPTTLVPF